MESAVKPWEVLDVKMAEIKAEKKRQEELKRQRLMLRLGVRA